MVDLLKSYSSSELAGWIAYLELEEQREYERMVGAMAYIASQLYGSKE